MRLESVHLLWERLGIWFDEKEFLLVGDVFEWLYFLIFMLDGEEKLLFFFAVGLLELADDGIKFGDLFVGLGVPGLLEWFLGNALAVQLTDMMAGW